ncbi:hypothetical protein HYH03_001887 [Edaphochlamys debaryana]|uniref:Uncharacterized protein n=1 Tax=Edaphochlamys debaryana TaxID=47281 RepID=A0A835YCX9_9CHLO|nr:hypothetical protein HYH03_001887 [Edaphochlamys debaryana]|eukprot:KAG2500311.1 hypothetical protein HYH03_001887 [Edaphochlamys debaryana]
MKTALMLVIGVWALCTLLMFHQHSFVAVSRFSYQDHVRQKLPDPVHVEHITALETNAAQAAAFVPFDGDAHRAYALILVGNYYGSSQLFLMRPAHGETPTLLRSLASVQTECGHSWTAWSLGGRQWAAVANYCTKDAHKGVVIYQLESLGATHATSPDWGFKAAATLHARGASHVLHFTLPANTHYVVGKGGAQAKTPPPVRSGAAHRGGAGFVATPDQDIGSLEHVMAVADYTAGEILIFGLTEDHDKGGLTASLVQKLTLPGVSALTACSTEVNGNPVHFLVGLAYFDPASGFNTRSAVYKYDHVKKQFVVLQILSTQGAHGGRCFPVRNSPPPDPHEDPHLLAAGTNGSAEAAVKEALRRAAKASGKGPHLDQHNPTTLILAIANSRDGEDYAANSTIWTYEPAADRFVMHQRVRTMGAHDVQHVFIPPPGKGRGGAGANRLVANRVAAAAAAHGHGAPPNGMDVLIFANRGYNQTCSPDERSYVLVWHPEHQRFELGASAALASCATGLASGTLAGHQYLVATGDRDPAGAYAGAFTHVWRLQAEDVDKAAQEAYKAAGKGRAAEAN